MSLKKSALSSTATRSIRHLRWSKDADGWGGDQEVVLSLIDDALPTRVEWVEGVGDRWSVWTFEEEADPQVEDIFLVDDIGVALVAVRIQENTDLRGNFHHYEIRCDEHSQSIADLEAQIP